MAMATMICASLTLAIILTIVPASYGNADSDALMALKRSLKDNDNVLQSWDPSLVDPCTWFHVACDANNRVNRVDLGQQNLGGSLPPELKSLSELQYLTLYGNRIGGSIPSEYGELKNLISIDLGDNSISGTIPPSLRTLTALKFLRLENNRLTGTIPRDIVTIKTLAVLNVTNNDLCGTVPPIPPHVSFSRQNNPRLGRPGPGCP